MRLLNLLRRRLEPAPPPVREVVGKNRFKGWLIFFQRVVGSDGQDYYAAIAKRRERVVEGDRLEWVPGDVHTGFHPTLRCAVIAGKNLVDREIRRDFAYRALDTIIERCGGEAFQC